MQPIKYYDVNKKPQLQIGYRQGNLTVCSNPYYIHPPGSNKHRRQFFDCQCDCGNIKEFVFGKSLKDGGGVLLYCSRSCSLYLENMPNSVPESNKKCKIGEKYHYLTITKEAFYHQHKGENNRHKCVEVICCCGNIKIYREDKVYKGLYKSCGCIWEHSPIKQKDWSHIKRKYGISQIEYNNILESQNGVCAICGSGDVKTKVTKQFFVDHCHITGKIRGLLCNQCNIGIGAFDENIDVIKKSIEYILLHK